MEIWLISLDKKDLTKNIKRLNIIKVKIGFEWFDSFLNFLRCKIKNKPKTKYAALVDNKWKSVFIAVWDAVSFKPVAKNWTTIENKKDKHDIISIDFADFIPSLLNIKYKHAKNMGCKKVSMPI